MADVIHVRTGVAFDTGTGRWQVVQQRDGRLYYSEVTYATEAEAEAAAHEVTRTMREVLDRQGIRWADRRRPGRRPR